MNVDSFLIFLITLMNQAIPLIKEGRTEFTKEEQDQIFALMTAAGADLRASIVARGGNV